MTATNNTLTNNTFSQSTVSNAAAAAQTSAIVLLAFGIAFVRAALLIVASVSLGAAARVFFPEMLVLPSSPVALLAAVAIDTFAVVAAVLIARAKSAAKAA